MNVAAACRIVLVALLVGSFSLPAFAAESVALTRLAALKAYLAASQATLQQYDWIETTVVSYEGEEEKFHKQQHCSYGADGKIRKVPVAQSGKEDYEFGFFGTNEIKRAEVVSYLQEAVRLVHQYLPLNPNGIQAVMENSKLSFGETNPGKQGRLAIRDFLYRGDNIDLDIDLATNQPLALKIHSVLATKGDPVTVSVTFGSLYGSASFAREAVLEAMGKKLKVTVRNADFKKIVP